MTNDNITKLTINFFIVYKFFEHEYTDCRLTDAKVSTNLSDCKRNKQISRCPKTQIIDYKAIT